MDAFDSICQATMSKLNTQIMDDIHRITLNYGINVNREKMEQALKDASVYYDIGYDTAKQKYALNNLNTGEIMEQLNDLPLEMKVNLLRQLSQAVERQVKALSDKVHSQDRQIQLARKMTQDEDVYNILATDDGYFEECQRSKQEVL